MHLIRRAIAAVLALLALPGALPAALPGAEAAGTGIQGEPHGRDFWQAIIDAEYALPERASAIALLRELSGLLGSRDAEERDTFAYGITARWIYVQNLLTPQELRELLGLWSGNLRLGIGESGSDSVLLRSFSALNLSILAALDNKSPWLERREFRTLLEAALAYFRDERDVRGHAPGVGWLHSAAHTADLLKFLGRSTHLEAGDQGRILGAISAKMKAPGETVYIFGEDERMARAVLSLVHREDFDAAGFEAWLSDLAGKAKGLWEGALDRSQLMEVQNTKNLLRSLFVLLSQEAAREEAGPRAGELRDRVLGTLAGL